MDILKYILMDFLTIVAGFAAGFFYRKLVMERNQVGLESLGKKILDEARKEADALKKESKLAAKDQLLQMKVDFEKETHDRRQELNQLERRLVQREEHLEKKGDLLDERDTDLMKKYKQVAQREEELKTQSEQYKQLLAEQNARLEQLAGMSANEAKEFLLRAMEREIRADSARMAKRIETEAKEHADRKAKEIIALAIKRYASDYVAEQTVSVVALPNEEMKGRIIGREGRNIRALEAATGVDIIIDDTPEAVILSAFNPVRREVARRSLERLISDGRIHPGRIEEIVEKVTQELEVNIREAGEEAAFDAGVHGIHPELIKLLGKLKFRTSYAQNVLQHSVEVCYLCGIMAAELGLNVKHAKRAGLLHDIGKAVDQESEGVHALIGADLAKRYGESPKVVHVDRRPPRRYPPGEHRGRPGPGGGHPVRGPSRGPPGDAGNLRQAPGRPGEGGPLLRRHQQVLRHPGGPGNPAHRRIGEGQRRGSGPPQPGGGQEDRAGPHLSRPDQGHRHPGDPVGGVRPVRRPRV